MNRNMTKEKPRSDWEIAEEILTALEDKVIWRKEDKRLIISQALAIAKQSQHEADVRALEPYETPCPDHPESANGEFRCGCPLCAMRMQRLECIEALAKTNPNRE